MLKVGRNDPCPCGSGKKYKRCCMDEAAKQRAEIMDDIEATVAMNPDLTTDGLNAVLQRKVDERNNRPLADFCGLSSVQMSNWLYASLDQLQGVTVAVPETLSTSPVMRYLALIVDEAMQNGGAIKATAKGNLPVKLVKQASALLPEFAVSQFRTHISISEFAGSKEDSFNALHYTRVLAELAGIIYRRSGAYHVKKAAQQQYQTQGIQAFFKPMLEAAYSQYNWGYLDGFQQDVDLRAFWLFMVWRLQHHASMARLTKEVVRAFPALVNQLEPEQNCSQEDNLGLLIELRFVSRFLEYWGFVTMNPQRFREGKPVARNVQIQPLFTQTFQFSVK